jgi:hypothetical protein
VHNILQKPVCNGEQNAWLFSGQTIGVVCSLCAVAALFAGSHSQWCLQSTLANLIPS